MPGAGTSAPPSHASPPPARCLDVSRLISRVGRGPMTGVDRVEFAYLIHLIDRPEPLYLLSRTALGHVLLDPRGAAVLRELLARGTAAEWDAPDLIGRLSRRVPEPRRRAEATLRRLAVARARRGGLGAMLARQLPPGTAYLNTGHANLSAEVLAAWRAFPGGRIAVLLHDTIPMDNPEFQRPGTPERFAAMLTRVAGAADLVICNSQWTRAQVVRRLTEAGRVPPVLVAHLGLDAVAPDPAALPAGIAGQAPYFVTLGTIEPRKNHALLLDVWEALERDPPAGGVPRLYLAGTRGWENRAVFDRLDRLKAQGAPVRELPGLGDAAVAALLAGSAGLLFPSRAEGFGLPPMEAAALGVRVLCADLPVYHEFMGDYPVYAAPDDVYFWLQTTRRWAEDVQADRRAAEDFRPSRWAEHFNLVLSAT